jgi:hypothetical protein
MRIYSIAFFSLQLLTTMLGAMGVSSAYALDRADFDRTLDRADDPSTTVTLETTQSLNASRVESKIPQLVAADSDEKPAANLLQSAPVSETRSPNGQVSQTPEIESSQPTIQILSPTSLVSATQFTDLVVQYPTGTKVAITVNQQPLDPATPTQTQENSTTNQTTQVWYRVPLTAEENIITAQAKGSEPVSITIKVKETAAQIEFLPTQQSRIPADGRSFLPVQGRILDEAGQPITKNAVVTLTASSGKFIGADHDKDRPGFQVLARDGAFQARLQSSLEAQMVRIRAAVDRHELVTQSEQKKPVVPFPAFNQPPYLLTPNPGNQAIEAYTQAEFITNLRPFILSGAVNLRFGQAGLDYFGSFQDYLRPSLLNQGYRVDFSTAAFAQGRIGEWLFTGAFNNQRALNKDCSGATRLFRDPQFCDQVYPVYGDSSTVDYLTPSIDSVYFKLERTSPTLGAGSDFAMWGDYTTSEFARSSQFYTATTRQLHGFKFNYNLGDLQLTGMYANNVSGFQRDAIAPNGTSGYYYLSRRLLTAGSENIFLETEEFNRPGTVVERKPLYRGTDYDIDYDRGAILFRRTINALEFDPFGRTLIRRIVATYQFEDLKDGGKLYAGRAQYNFSRDLGKEIWAAVTYLQENQGGQRFQLYGGDALISLGKNAQFIAEIARSDFDSTFRGDIGGFAYRFELLGAIAPGVVGKAFYRSVESGFVNNASASFTPGQTRYGAEISAKVTPTTQATVQFDREINFGIAPAVRGLTSITRVGFGDLFNPTSEPIPGSRVDNSFSTFRAGVLQKIGSVELGLDFVRRSRQDRVFPQRLEADTNQFISRLNYPILKTLTFRVQDERNLGSSPDPLYPNRTTIGLDWAAAQDVTVRLAQQFIGSTSQLKNSSFTSLDVLSDKRLSDDTTFTNRYSLINGVNGWSSQAAIGLNHRILLAPGLRANLGFERISGDVVPYTGAGQQFLQAIAPGQSAASLGLSAFTSYSIGLDYTDNPNFKANGRFEYRDGEGRNDTMVISAGAAGKLSPAFTMLGRYQQGNFANQLLTDAGLADTINLKVGMAYRSPTDDKFNALLRYEYRQNSFLTPDTTLFGQGTKSNVHLVALETIYAPNWRWEFYGKFALRSTTSYRARDLLGTNSITLGQLRAAYRLGYQVDVAGEVRWIGQSVIGFDEVGLAVEAGYYFTPNLRVALGYNFGQANDRDLSRNKDGVYVTLSLKLDQLFSGFGVTLPDRKVAPPQQQESLVKPLATQTAPTPTSNLPPPNSIQQPASVQSAEEVAQ